MSHPARNGQFSDDPFRLVLAWQRHRSQIPLALQRPELHTGLWEFDLAFVPLEEQTRGVVLATSPYCLSRRNNFSGGLFVRSSPSRFWAVAYPTAGRRNRSRLCLARFYGGRNFARRVAADDPLCGMATGTAGRGIGCRVLGLAQAPDRRGWGRSHPPTHPPAATA